MHNRLKQQWRNYELEQIDMRPCRIPEDDFRAALAKSDSLAPLDERAEFVQPCSRCAANQRWALRVCLISLAGCVAMAVLAAWRN